MSVKGSNKAGEPEDVVVRKAERGWVVGDENVSDLTSAMVLADLFAADQSDGDDTTLVEAVDEQGAARPAGRAAAPCPRAAEPASQRVAAESGAAGIAARQARPARQSGLRSPLPSLSTRWPPGSGSSRRSACSPSATGSAPAKRSTCCARRPGHAARGSPNSPRT